MRTACTWAGTSPGPAPARPRSSATTAGQAPRAGSGTLTPAQAAKSPPLAASASPSVAAVARADAGDEAEHAQACHGVARVLGEAQERHQVFDVGHLDEAQAAVLAKGDVAARELDLEQQRVMLGAEQHRLGLSARALLAVLEDAVAEPRRSARLRRGR